MPVRLTNTGDCVMAAISGDVDHHSLPRIRAEIDAVIDHSAPKWLVLDFSAVTFMDSSGIGLILGRMRLLEGIGGKIAVTGAVGYPERIIKLAGLGSLLQKTPGAIAGRQKEGVTSETA